MGGMARRALSAARTVEVLNFLASHPGEGYTLSELAEHAQVNVASMHAVLAVLTHSGFVTRDPRRKAYRLGLSAIGVGLAALDDHPVIKQGRETVTELATRLELECLLSVPIGAELLTIAEAGRSERLYMRPRVGQRLPFMPPLAILAVDYLPEPEREAWLSRIGSGATEADKQAYRDAAHAGRQLGYAVELETPSRHQISLLMPQLAKDPRSPQLNARLTQLVAQLGHEHHQLENPQPGSSYPVNNIQAPIFDEHAQLVAGLALLGFDEPLTTEEIQAHVHTVLTAAEHLTRSTGGHIPLTPPPRHGGSEGAQNRAIG
jgi:DNA-binding IclR family transcriptional regulator